MCILKKFTALLPFLVIIVICVAAQTVMLSDQQFLPYPEPFGRETPISVPASGSTLQQTADSEFAYISDSSLTYAKLDSAARVQLSSGALPEQDKSQINNLKLTHEQAYWTDSNHHLFTSRLENAKWTPKTQLSTDTITAFDIISDSKGDFVVWSSGQKIELGQLRDQKLIPLQSISSGDVQLLKAAKDKQGTLAIAAVVKTSDNVTDLWLFQAPAAADAPIKQVKVKSISLSAFMRVDELQVGLDSSHVYLFYETLSSKSMKTNVQYASMPWNSLSPVADGELEIKLGNSRFEQPHQPFVAAIQQNELRMAVTAMYVKNSRFSRPEPFLVTFKNGIPVGATLVSASRGYAANPIYLSSDKGEMQVAWLWPKNETSSDVFYTTDNAAYKQQMNQLNAKDFVWSLKNVPLFFGMAFMVLLISFKWFPLSYLYLFVLLLFKENDLDKKARLHFWVATGMYLMIKTIFIGDYYKPSAIENMPAFITHSYSPYVFILISFLFSYVSTRSWRRHLDGRYPIREFSYFLAVDILLSTLWYAYFFTTVSI